MSVCLSACVSEKYMSKLHQIFRTCYLWPWPGPLMAVQYTPYFQFVDKVMCSRDRGNGQVQATIGKEEYLYYSTICTMYSVKSAQALITRFYLQITPCLPFLCRCSPDGATPNSGSRHPVAAYYSFIDT